MTGEGGRREGAYDRGGREEGREGWREGGRGGEREGACDREGREGGRGEGGREGERKAERGGEEKRKDGVRRGLYT